MKTFLGVAAALAWLFGAALIFAPRPFHQPSKIALTPVLPTLAPQCLRKVFILLTFAQLGGAMY